jgi:hypothetical protein
MTTIEKLNAMMNEFEMAKKANYDSTTTSHPSGSLEDKMSDPPGDGAPGKKMTQDANEHTAADKPVGEMAELTPVKTDKDENPLDTPAHSVGSGKSDTEPGTKDTKDDPGTSLPNAEVGEKYAKLNDKDLTTAAAQVADRAMARILKSGTAAPAKTPAQDAAAAGYAAAAMAGNAEKAAAIRDMLGQTIYDTIESARGAAAIIKQANADMLAAGGGAPPMDPAAMGCWRSSG